MVVNALLRGLEVGKFYEDKNSGNLYFVDTNRVVALPSGVRLNPTKNPPHGLSSLHDDQVDIRNFQEVDPLQYLNKKRVYFNELVEAVIEYNPALKKEGELEKLLK